MTARDLIACLRAATDREIESIRDLLARPVRAVVPKGRGFGRAGDRSSGISHGPDGPRDEPAE